MNFETIEELEEAFNYLRKNKENQATFQGGVSNYINHLGGNKELAPIIRKLALGKKIPVDILQIMFNSFMMPGVLNLFSKTPLQYPPFWDNLIEEKFGLSAKFQKVFLRIQNNVSAQTALTKKQKWKDSFSKKDYKVLEKIHESIIEQSMLSTKQFSNIRKGRIKKLRFNNKESKLLVNDKIEVDVQALTTGSLLCAYMFSPKIKCNEPVDWLTLYEKIIDQEIDFTNKGKTQRDKRKLRDAMNAVNKKVRSEFGTEANIFKWKDNQIKRLY